MQHTHTDTHTDTHTFMKAEIDFRLPTVTLQQGRETLVCLQPEVTSDL